MKKYLVEALFLLALAGFAAAQTTPSTSPSNTNNSGVQNPTQQSTPTPNPNSPPPPDVNANPSPSATGTATPNGSANPDATTTKSGDADQNTAITPNPSSSTPPPPQDTAAQNNGTTAKKSSLVGCLESSGEGQFTIRAKSGDVSIVPSSMLAGNLADHVGEKVRVHGSYSGTETAMNSDTSKLPQSDQTATATGKNETENPAKPDMNGQTRASGTAADTGTASTATREFRADSISMMSKTCTYNKK